MSTEGTEQSTTHEPIVEERTKRRQSSQEYRTRRHRFNGFLEPVPVLVLLFGIIATSALSRSIGRTYEYSLLRGQPRSALTFVSTLQRRQARGLAFSTSPFGFLSPKASSLALEGMASSKLAFVDIGANLLDERFTEGVYHGKHRHEPDWNEMLQRAQEAGVKHIILTAGTLRESQRALDLVRTLRQVNQTIHFGCTIGVHPTRCSQEFLNNEGMPPEKVLEQLKALAIDGQSDKSVVAL
jgi:hypothetical protein